MEDEYLRERAADLSRWSSAFAHDSGAVLTLQPTVSCRRNPAQAC
jgi:hypothetical protein